MVMKNLTSSQDALFRGQDSAVEFWDNLDQSIQGTYEPLWDWTLYVAMAANICLALLSFGIMWMIAVPAQNSRARRRLDAPFCWCNRRTFSMLFWIVVVLAWIFGLWFSVGTVLTSDTCGKIDTPNALASELLQRWASSHPSSEPLLARWMIAFQKQDCVSVLSQAELNSTPWLQLVEPTHRLSTALQALPPNIYFDVCGTALWPLQDSLDRLSERLCDFTSALQLDSHRNDECGSAIASWYPDFASIMVDSICDQGSKALVWVTATQALILCMIMVVWTCRSAFLPEQVEKEKEERGNSCCCRCSCRPSFSCGLMQRLKSQSFSHQWYLSKNASSYSHHSSIGSSSEDEEQRNHAQDGYVQP